MRIISSFLLGIGLSLCLTAQVDRGSISGTVTDATGAVVAGASVNIHNDDTNASFRAASSSTGSFAFFNLPIGLYTLRSEAAGFRRQEVKGIKVEVNQQAKVDVSMQVGEVTQTVEVEASASLIQAESTDVGTVIDNKRFLDLPLTLGGGIRNPSAFIYLSPGVSPGSTWEKHIGGGGSFNDQIYFDGIALSRGDLANDAEVNPSVDAIGEFKLVTNNYSAEYTHALSGVTSFTMKSGTNALHGSAFEFDDNDKFDARGFYPATKAPRKQNEWGFTAGGADSDSKSLQRQGPHIFLLLLRPVLYPGRPVGRQKHASHRADAAGRFRRMGRAHLRSAFHRRGCGRKSHANRVPE